MHVFINLIIFYSSSQLFGILNNGITIVTDEIKPVGEKFTLHNYQIPTGLISSVTIVIPLFNIPNNCEDEPLRQSCMFLG
jgi:hypothetical protein